MILCDVISCVVLDNIPSSMKGIFDDSQLLVQLRLLSTFNAIAITKCSNYSQGSLASVAVLKMGSCLFTGIFPLYVQ